MSWLHPALTLICITIAFLIGLAAGVHSQKLNARDHYRWGREDERMARDDRQDHP
jgi:hypothetical protein